MTATHVDPAELRDRLASPDRPRLVDVRTPAEFETAHIPGSVNVPLDLLRAHAAELGPPIGPTPVLVCATGSRAEQAARLFPDARVLTRGVAGWEAAGGDVARGRPTWALDRQVRFTAGALVLLGLLGSLLVPGLQWFSAVIGAALVVTASIGICPMADLLARMPWNRGPTPVDLDRAAAALAGEPVPQLPPR
ncbi:rhodanese-like domain-containing protein [Pseudonocardia humida]|uniref:Rhodanese-like domain-containing protein n=1 Tax=Pseudonocardia humida TaxID=2800819 RepID=A0ABT1AE66_9PSEU|nr:rhodanese-like domain-containing protein [Pseudonocardia humida]MCO1660949.1 rhodanese-like domain-containing protein [Pseudonocardia humida]